MYPSRVNEIPSLSLHLLALSKHLLASRGFSIL